MRSAATEPAAWDCLRLVRPAGSAKARAALVGALLELTLRSAECKNPQTATTMASRGGWVGRGARRQNTRRTPEGGRSSPALRPRPACGQHRQAQPSPARLPGQLGKPARPVTALDSEPECRLWAEVGSTPCYCHIVLWVAAHRPGAALGLAPGASQTGTEITKKIFWGIIKIVDKNPKIIPSLLKIEIKCT